MGRSWISDTDSPMRFALFVSMVIADILAVLVPVAGFSLETAAQTVSTSDPSVTATDIIVSRAHAFAVGEGTIWVLTKNTLLKVDPTDNRLVSVPVEEMKVPYSSAQGLMITMKVGGGSVWVVGEAHKVHGIHRIDSVTGKCVATIPLEKRKGGRDTALAYGLGALWVLNELDGTLVRIDPDRNKIAATIQLGKGGWYPPQVGEGAVWIMGFESGVVKRVDPQSNKVEDEFPAGQPHHFSLLRGTEQTYSFSVGLGALWVVDSGESSIWRIDPKTHERIASIPLQFGEPPLFLNNSVWVGSTEIDPGTNKVLRTILFPDIVGGETGLGSAAGGDSLWFVSVRAFHPKADRIRRVQPYASGQSKTQH